MIRNAKRIRKFEDELTKREQGNYLKNLKIFEELYREAIALGALPPKNPLEGTQENIKLAKVLNSVCKTNSKDRKNSKRV